MKARLIAVLVLAMIVMAAQATIYRYDAKDGKRYYTNERPTGLTTAERAKLISVPTADWDKLTAASPNKKKETDDRVEVGKIVKKDSAPVVVIPTCVAPQVLNAATNKCETPPPPICVAPQVLNTATNTCETPPAPTCKPEEKLDAVTNKCVARCLAPEVWNATAGKCEVLPIPTTPVGTAAPPDVAVACNGAGEQCKIPAGITAKVWFGVATKWVTKDNVTGSIGCNTTAMGDPKSGTYNRCFYVDNKLLEHNLDPKGQNLMPAVNLALVPKGSAGFSGAMIKNAPVPSKATEGAFRISCEYSHMSNDDPIVFPGVPNATHHHTFFGNTAANAYSTNETLRNSGNSTCAGGILNRSGYWMPSLIDTSTGAPVKPSVVVVYYKTIDEKSGPYIKSPPAGLRMIAGKARPLSIAQSEAEYTCQDQTQVMNPANWGILWTANHIKKCGGPNQILRMIVSFPQCWDGKNLDSPDHQSHMAYSCGDECEDATGKITKSANSCPASHPVAIPNITINADFPDLKTTAEYRLASDNYSTAYPGGYSLHADWMNGWDESIIQRMVKNCLNEPKNCGGPNLGDGYTLYGVNQD